MSDWKAIVKSIAPALGAALAGPAGATATKLIAEKILGYDATDADIQQTITHITPEIILKLKEIEREHYQIDAQDRDSARTRQTNMHDWTPNIIAIVYMIFFFGLIYYFGRDGILEQENVLLARLQDILLIMITYFFGSSSGSRLKDKFFGK